MSSSQRIYESTYGPLHVPTDVSVPQFLLRWNPDDVHPNKVIASDFDNPTSKLTYGDVRSRPAHGATGLVNRMGVKEGDVVVLFGLNSVNWLLLAHSIMWAGALFAGINAVATSHELVHYFEISEPKVVAVDRNLYPKVEAALQMSNKSQGEIKVLIIEDGTSASAGQDLPLFPRDIMNYSSGRPPLDLTYRDNRTVPAAMCFSSGTSGKPKGVLLSHHNLIAYSLNGRASTPLIANYRSTEIFFPPFRVGLRRMFKIESRARLTEYQKLPHFPYSSLQVENAPFGWHRLRCVSRGSSLCRCGDQRKWSSANLSSTHLWNRCRPYGTCVYRSAPRRNEKVRLCTVSAQVC